jgi:hypothetical protein
MRVMASSFFRFLDHTHNDAPQFVGLLWTSDQLVAETSTWQHATLTTDKLLCPPVEFEHTIWASERPQTYALDRAAGHWDRHSLPFKNSKFTPLQATKTYRCSRNTAQLLLTSALVGVECLVSRLVRFTHAKEQQYPFYTKMYGLQKRSGWFLEKTRIKPLLGFKLWTVQHVSSRITDWAIAVPSACAEQLRFELVKRASYLV